MITHTDREMTLTEAANSLPGRPYTKKLLRWIREGVWTGPRGRRRQVFLKARKIGGMWYVTASALEAFIADLTPAAQKAAETPRRRERLYRRQAQRRHERAMAELKAQGF